MRIHEIRALARKAREDMLTLAERERALALLLDDLRRRESRDSDLAMASLLDDYVARLENGDTPAVVVTHGNVKKTL